MEESVASSAPHCCVCSNNISKGFETLFVCPAFYQRGAVQCRVEINQQLCLSFQPAAQQSTLLCYISLLLTVKLGREIDDYHRNPNINDSDHLAAQQSNPIPQNSSFTLLLKTFSCFPICLYCTPVRHMSLLHCTLYVSIALDASQSLQVHNWSTSPHCDAVQAM